MTVLGRQILVATAKLYDLAVMSTSFGLAILLEAHQTAGISFADLFTERVTVRNFVIYIGLLFSWHILFCLFGLYDSRQPSERIDEVLDIVKATTLGVSSASIGIFFFSSEIVSPSFVLVLWSISSATLISTRVIGRYLLARMRSRSQNLREVLIVGTNPRARLFAQKLRAKPTLGYRVLGFVDQEWEGTKEFLDEGYPLTSDFDNFPCLLRDRVVDEVVLSLPMKSMYVQASRVAALCEEQGIVVRVLSNVFDLQGARSRAEEVEGEAVTTYTGSPEDWQHLFKRTLDVAVSLATIAILAPLFLVVALIVKLTSEGPVIFVQERVGLNNRRFHVYKFRTMVADAEARQREIEHLNEVQGPVFKIKNDPRLTPAGSFLRKMSIDELPQLYNVLKGDMSLVGPRPLSVRDYNKFDREWRRRRFSARPGITGLWQVNGRSGVPFEKWMELDLEYIDNWSLSLDFKILAKTIPAVLKGTGAA